MLNNNIIIIKKINSNYSSNAELIRREYPGAAVLDITADGLMARLDPSAPVGKLNVPGMERERGLSLKGIWEGLKVFKKKDTRDNSWWRDERKALKTREFKSYGKLLGIRLGDEVVGLEKAREIFEGMYAKLLQERFDWDLEIIRRESRGRVVVLLDYAEGDPRKFINHAAIIRSLVAGEEIRQPKSAA